MRNEIKLNTVDQLTRQRLKKEALERASQVEPPKLPANYDSSMLNNDSLFVPRINKPQPEQDPYSL